MAFKAFAQVGHKKQSLIREVAARREELRRGAGGGLAPSFRDRLMGGRPGFRAASDARGGVVGVRVAVPLSSRIRDARVANRTGGPQTTIREGRQADRSQSAGVPHVGGPFRPSTRNAQVRIRHREAAGRDKMASPSIDLQAVGKRGPMPGRLAQPFQWRPRRSPETDTRKVVPNPPRGMRFF